MNITLRYGARAAIVLALLGYGGGLVVAHWTQVQALVSPAARIAFGS